MLKDAIGGIRDEAVALSEQGIWIALTGLIILLTDKVMKSSVANWALVAQFSDWLFNRGLRSGLPVSHVVFSAIFMILIIIAAVLRYSLLGWFSILSDFPTDPDYGLNSITWVEVLFAFCVANREMVFDLITYGIRMILDALELVFVKTPWIVIASLIVLLTRLTAGIRTAIWLASFLAYMGLLGFWEKAMTTLALLGKATCLSVLIGIPVGMFCACRPRIYSFIQLFMDFMQTMPAFVFMMPVIAFFGSDKPAALVSTLIFGGTPVVRLTVLCLRGVPDSVREAAVSFGANK